ncbi:iron ABC transporter permease [Victivallis vadensis]|uniref:ABC transporter permease n=1 Tax=Victivallis vadensis TaxID=172901 RepID=UPI00266C9117|nr:iron ABC transporter permease [Victivallis vadensis]
MRQFYRYMLLFLVIAFLAVFLIGPVYTVVEVGLDWRLLGEVFSNYIYVEGLLNSFCIAAVTTLMVFAISLPLALLYDRYEFPGKNWCNLLMMLPMILPPFVGALGFQQILGHYGVINTLLASCGFEPVDFLGGRGRFWSVCFIEALHLYPILYLNLVTALGNLDPQLNEAARNLGASWWTRFRRITLPLMKPGIFAGGSIVLVWSFTELGTPLMFGFNRVTAVQIFNGIMELETNPVPYALVVVMLFFAAMMYLAGKFVLGRNAANSTVKGNAGSAARPPAGWRRFLPTGVFALVTLLAAMPHIALIFTAFSLRWYGTVWPEHFTLLNFENALSNKIVIPSIVNSLRYSVLAMLVAVATGVLISLAAVRWKLRGSSFADLLAMLPLAVPGIVVAFGFLGMSVKYDWAAEWFNPVENPLWLLAVAYAVRRLPYVVRSVSAGLEQTPEELENAARNYGAGPWRVLRKITLPLILANVIVGGLFAFSFSMLEVSDSLILAQKAEFYPITRAIYELSQILGSGPFIACAFGVWAMLFLAATLAAAGAILGRKIGSIFKL